MALKKTTAIADQLGYDYKAVSNLFEDPIFKLRKIK